MNMPFIAGCLVHLVNDDWSTAKFPDNYLFPIKGEVYIVSFVTITSNGIGLILAEIPNEHVPICQGNNIVAFIEPTFNASRFEVLGHINQIVQILNDNDEPLITS